eukprot:c7962_g1_i1.p1 GENE.c7962_g1_i1~~c7962_g1_i1.p1  ORF type:complete len:605 (+),score=108.31 c7962_g1_i1:146-1960(+)
MQQKVVLVTGGAGFIGSATARALLRRGETVVIVDEVNNYYDVSKKDANIRSLFDEFGSQSLTFYRGDFCNKALVETIFSQHKPDIVCHLGARAGVRPSIEDPLLYVHSNIEGTAVLLEASVRHNITNFVYASSSSVYGGSENEVFRESDNVNNPYSQYAASKAACELLASTYHHLYKLNVCGLRFFTVYGPNGRPDMAPYKFIDRIFRGLPIDQFGDGDSERDYTYVDDIVQGVLGACDHLLGCSVFNLGNGSPVLLRDFIATIENLIGKKAIINQLPNQPGDVPRTCADISLAREKLGYNPQTSIFNGLQKTVAWYLEHAARKVPTNPTSQVNIVSSFPSKSHQILNKTILTVAFRVHRHSASTNVDIDISPLQQCVVAACNYATHISVAVDADDDQLFAAVKDMKSSQPSLMHKLQIVPVHQWGNFVPALNALLLDAMNSKSDFILFQSVEIETNTQMVQQLLSQMDADTLVAGACLAGHTFHKGSQPLDGTSCPWNTFAVWDVRKLAKTGFLLVSEGMCEGTKSTDAGVEEAAVIAIHQMLSPQTSLAKLVEVSGLTWYTEFEDSKRAHWHQQKMESKRTRAQSQLSALGTTTAYVLHLSA